MLFIVFTLIILFIIYLFLVKSPKSNIENPHLYFTMGTTAENVAKKYSIDRRAQQEFAISSHNKAYEAQSKGKFQKEIYIHNIK